MNKLFDFLEINRMEINLEQHMVAFDAMAKSESKIPNDKKNLLKSFRLLFLLKVVSSYAKFKIEFYTRSYYFN